MAGMRWLLMGFLLTACVPDRAEPSGDDDDGRDPPADTDVDSDSDSDTDTDTDSVGCEPGVFDGSNFDGACFQ